MKRITLFACILCFGFFTTTQALAGEPATFDGLVKKVVTALQSGDQAGFQQLFITMEAMDKSITELETYPSKK